MLLLSVGAEHFLYTRRGMSLKAKIEAVIYASEEPVTLAQLMGLLGQEAQTELDELAAAQQTRAAALTSATPARTCRGTSE